MKEHAHVTQSASRVKFDLYHTGELKSSVIGQPAPMARFSGTFAKFAYGHASIHVEESNLAGEAEITEAIQRTIVRCTMGNNPNRKFIKVGGVYGHDWYVVVTPFYTQIVPK